MRILYQHELRKNLISLNEGLECEQVDRLIRTMSDCIKLNKKYFPNDYLTIFEELTKERGNFEALFNLLLHSSSVKEWPLHMFLPVALYDISTDHKNDFIGHMKEKWLEIIANNENDPGSNELYSRIAEYDEELIDSQYKVSKSQAHHVLNTGNQLVEFLKSYIALEKQEMAQGVAELVAKKDSVWMAKRWSSELKKSTGMAEKPSSVRSHVTFNI